MNQIQPVLAFDLGAESGRAIIGAFDGETLKLSEVHRFLNTPITVPDDSGKPSLHWNVLGLWSEIKQGLGKAVQEYGALASVGIDTWGVDFALLDRQGKLLANPLHYRDDRTDGMLEAAGQIVPRAEIFERTGIQFMAINSLYQLYSLVVNDSPLFDVAQTFLTIPDLFHYWLTGQKACEFTNATTTQAYDPRAQDWAKGMLDQLQIPTHIFPGVVTPGTLLGKLRPTLAEELGIERLAVVVPACHDTGSAVAGVPATGSGFAWLSSGTWSIMGVEAPEPVINEQTLSYNMTNEGGVNNTFRLCKNVMGLWLLQESLRTWSRGGSNYSYDDIVQLAVLAPPLHSFVDPDDGEFVKPGDMPERVRTFCQKTGQPIPEGHGAIARCILESLALKYRLVLERLETLVGQRLEPIHIVGGGSQNRLLNQFTADATGRQVVTGPVEATATGNLIVQAIAAGLVGSLIEGRELISRSFEMETFEPGAGDAWDDAYEKFLGLLTE